MNDLANRIRFRKLFLQTLQLATALCCFSYANAQEVLFRQVADSKTDTHVEVTSLFSNPSLGGFHPVRVFISNKQKSQHNIYLKFQSSTDYQGSLSTTSNFSFKVEPGKSATYDILVPLSAQNGNSSYEQFKASLSGSMGKTSYNDNVRFNVNQPIVLLSDTLHTPNGSALDSEVISRTTTTSYRGAAGQFSSRFSPSQLPDDWRAFSGYDSILMTDNDWMAIPPGPRNAITAWLRLGGQLIIYSENSQNPSALGLPKDASFGEYKIELISGDRLVPKTTVDLVYNRAVKTRIASVTNDFDIVWPLQNELGKKTFSSIIFILILIVFGIIVGPVNLFVFAKSGRRHRLFITTPIISLVTSLLLVVLIILQDGFGGEGSRLVLMEVRPDENQNAAFIHQEQFSRTGVMTSPSFTIEDSALFVPVPIRSTRWSRFTDNYNTTGNYDLQPTGSKLFANGSWFQSRSEQGQLISAVVPTRGRIELTNQAGRLVSNFDFPIKTLLYRDDDDNWHRADSLTKGKPAKLTSIDPTMVQPILNDLNVKFSERNKSFLKKVQERSGHYIAITTEAPAVETHPSIDWQTTTIITGPIVR
jgi:hypothetical protein